VLCNEELSTSDANSCQCQVFWDGPQCNVHFIDVYPIASYLYSITFALGFLFISVFSANEIYKHLTELDESAQKMNKHMSSQNIGAQTRRRSSTLKFNRPKSMGRSTLISGFFQPTRVRILVQSCCFFASFLRFLYLFTVSLRVCYEGSVCTSIIFEPANVAVISAALLTVMFWKKMGMMFKKGTSKSSQNDEDVRFFQIFGFYTVFSLTMIIVVNTASAMNIDVHALYNIQLLVSGMYLVGLLYGCIMFGMTLIHLLHGGAQDAKSKEKTWKKVRKVVHMLAIVVPSGILYLLGLMTYMGMGMRAKPGYWMPMQYIFRSCEAAVLWGLTSCLKGRPPKPGQQHHSFFKSKTSSMNVGKKSSKGASTSSISEETAAKSHFGQELSMAAKSHIDIIHEEAEENERDSNFV